MRIKLCIAAFLLSVTFHAQEFTGKAIYKTHRKMDMKFGGEGSTMSEAQQKQMEKQMQKMFQKTFILNFTKSESIYKEDVALKGPKKPSVGGMEIMIVGNGGGNDVFYKNIKEKRYVNKAEIMGKRFLIKDKLKKYDWQLSSETKNIGNYTCYKATFSREQELVNFSMVNGKHKEVKNKVTIVTTAWYTPQVPVSNGPSEFGGLPGLILELNEGDLTMVCTEIVLNPTKKVKIEEPTKGKVVTQDKFDKIMQKKSKEMMENFRSKRGNEIEIRIGG